MAIKLVQADSVLDNKVKTHINESIDQYIKRWALIGAWLLISVIFGFMIATIWDLNGKIYEVAGKQEIQYDSIDDLKGNVHVLKNENDQLRKDNSILVDERIDIKRQLEELRKENVELKLNTQRAKGEQQ